MHSAIAQQRRYERLKNAADPADADRLPPLDRTDRLRVAGQKRQAEVGTEGFGDGADDGPALARGLDQRHVRRSGDVSGVIVFDQQQIGAHSQNRTELAGAALRDRRAGRILSARSHDNRLCATHCAQELFRQHAFVVKRDGHAHERQCREDVQNTCEAGIFDDHPVAGPEMLAQNAFDAVERTADDRDAPCRHLIRPEVASGSRQEVALVEIVAIKPLLHAETLEMTLQVRKQREVGVACGEIAHAAGRRGRGGRGGGGGADAGAAAPVADRQSAILQDPVGGADRASAHAELLRQIPHGRKFLARGDLSRGHGGLDAARDFDSRSSADVSLF